MGIDTSERRRDWLDSVPEYMIMKFPEHQRWAAAFITVGAPTETNKPFMDFSAYRTLAIDMKGAKGGEQVWVGVKTNTQPSNGREAKIPYTLTADWHVYTTRLQDLVGTDLGHLYVVTEFVYNSQEPQTIFCRSIKYLR